MPEENNANNTNNNPQGNPPTNQQQTETTQETWEGWLEKQEEHVRQLFETHVKGLKSTVQATRQERDDLARQVKELASKVEKGSEAEKALMEFSTRLETAEKRATFAEEAGKAEIGCMNPKAAWLIAQADGLFDKRGNPDWSAIKAAAPELFGKPAPRSNAGSGTGNPPPAAQTMNDFIRRAAGK